VRTTGPDDAKGVSKSKALRLDVGLTLSRERRHEHDAPGHTDHTQVRSSGGMGKANRPIHGMSGKDVRTNR
jgi:hypothetical protein